MNIFDIMGIVSKVPYDSVQKLQGDIPKIERLAALVKQAEPHVDAMKPHLAALEPIAKEAEEIYNQISPDVMSVLKAIGT